MARNLQLHVLRGTFAHMPVLGPGELYFCTDTQEIYAGNTGNKRLGVSSTISTLGSGNATLKGPNAWITGPTIPSTVKAFAQVNIAGTVYWIPLMQ